MKVSALVLAGLTLLGGSATAQDIGFEEGQFLPDFELPTIDGERTTRLSELRGKRVLLIQFASW
jgi:hypothetical protein